MSSARNIPDELPAPSSHKLIFSRQTRFGFLWLGELCLVVTTIACFAAYHFFNLSLINPLGLFLERIGSLVLFYGFCLFPLVLVVRFRHLRAQRPAIPTLVATWRLFKLIYLSKTALIDAGRYLFGMAWLFVLFIQLKNLAPLLNKRIFDPFFVRFERSLFQGQILATSVFAELGPESAKVLSEGYLLFYPFVSLLIYIMLFQGNSRLREEFYFSFTLTWIIGAFFVLLIPTLGPCFFENSGFPIQDLPTSGVSGMQESIWRLRINLLESRRGINLISGFPSLHVAITVLGALTLWRVSRTLSLLAWIFTILTYLTTFYFGWHYLFDDIGGAMLAVYIYRVARSRFMQYSTSLRNGSSG